MIRGGHSRTEPLERFTPFVIEKNVRVREMEDFGGNPEAWNKKSDVISGLGKSDF